MDAVFETELMSIQGVEQPKPISSASESVISGTSSVTSSLADDATEGIKEKIVSKVGEAAEATKVIIQDTDGDGQEHNEL
jgi:FK506-binding protein 2